MNLHIPNGGAAFPIPGLQHDEDFNGMSLRDYFAAAALTGILAKGENEMHPDARARESYALADAMLKAREAA